MAKKAFERLRKICLSLPEAQEEIKWENPHFTVRGKIFCGCGDEGGQLVAGFKLPKDQASALCEDERFWPSPYVGKHGWVSTDLATVRDWKQLRGMIVTSYRLIAPKRLSAELDASG